MNIIICKCYGSLFHFPVYDLKTFPKSRCVIGIVVGNRHGDSITDLRRVFSHFINLHPAMCKA